MKAHSLYLDRKYGENVYSFHVHNHQHGVYQTNIYLNDAHEVMDMECSCPYEHGGYCKHEIAALLVVMQELTPEVDAVGISMHFADWLIEETTNVSLMEHLFKEEAEIVRSFNIEQFLKQFPKPNLLAELREFDRFSDMFRIFLYMRYRNLIKQRYDEKMKHCS